MARCKGTTRSGSRCRLDAQPGSEYCHLHAPAQEQEEESTRDGSEAETLEMGDLVPLILAGAMVAGFFLVMKTLGRWMPRF